MSLTRLESCGEWRHDTTNGDNDNDKWRHQNIVAILECLFFKTR